MDIVEKLYKISIKKSAEISPFKKRYVFNKALDSLKSRRITLLSGLRGVGKTTLMLQIFNEMKEKTFYFSADSVILKTTSLFDIVERLEKEGYTFILIDEIHKSVNWINELKTIYDSFDLNILCSGSSPASIEKGNILLGRRSSMIKLNPLSFGEFIYLKTGKKLKATLSQALSRKKSIEWVARHSFVERYFKEYLHSGGFPFSINMAKNDLLFNSIRKMIYEDALSEFRLTDKKVDIAEKLLTFLAKSPPGEFSYNSFSNLTGYPKSSIYETAEMLKEMSLINIVEGERVNYPPKLLFFHPNLRVAFTEQLEETPNVGALREEYFVFHISNLNFKVFVPKKAKKYPDYICKRKSISFIAEIGGSSKSREQVKGKGYVLSEPNLIVLGFVQDFEQK